MKLLPLAALLLPIQPTPVEVLVQAGLVPLVATPSAEAMRCANRSDRTWFVSGENGAMVVGPDDAKPAVDPLPFDPEPAADRFGGRHVLRADEGWIVGFDAGEFGGGLWWFSEGGGASIRIRPPHDASTHPEDTSRADNVVGFASLGRQRLVFTGMDHLGSTSGRVFRLESRSRDWSLTPVAVLDSRPAAWVVGEEEILVLTGSGLWGLEASGRISFLHSLNLSGLYPDSMERGSDGALYIGMRLFVLRLEPSEDGWSPSWFAPSDCNEDELAAGECECVRTQSGQ